MRRALFEDGLAESKQNTSLVATAARSSSNHHGFKTGQDVLTITDGSALGTSSQSHLSFHTATCQTCPSQSSKTMQTRKETTGIFMTRSHEMDILDRTRLG